ncbi:MAG: metal-dependent transcriptional regulator [Planctomycetota bacterium]
MPTETVENYLKAIYCLETAGHVDHVANEDRPTSHVAGRPVALGDVAAAVRVTPGTATTMVKKLAADRLVKYERYGGVTLTAAGEKLALSVLRRHRLVETFLVRTLGMVWSEVHDEAERLEHAISERLLERLDSFLGRPVVDPHGDPIPDGAGKLRKNDLVAIARCKPGITVRLARVLDQRPEFLQFLDRHGLRIDSTLTIVSTEPGAGTVLIRVAKGAAVALSDAAASNLLVDVKVAKRRTPMKSRAV